MLNLYVKHYFIEQETDQASAQYDDRLEEETDNETDDKDSNIFEYSDSSDDYIEGIHNKSNIIALLTCRSRRSRLWISLMDINSKSTLLILITYT